VGGIEGTGIHCGGLKDPACLRHLYTMRDGGLLKIGTADENGDRMSLEYFMLEDIGYGELERAVKLFGRSESLRFMLPSVPLFFGHDDCIRHTFCRRQDATVEFTNACQDATVGAAVSKTMLCVPCVLLTLPGILVELSK
jgi:hypothetical protein